MPSLAERRGIDFFIQTHNGVSCPKIIERSADEEQESPDAICKLENGQRIGLELTSALPPKGSNIEFSLDITYVTKVLNRKFQYNYRCEGLDGVWLVLQFRRTLPEDLLHSGLANLVPPAWYDRVYLQGPVLQPAGRSKLALIELISQQLWYPGCDRAV
jgi:hypothetical protein